MDRGHRTVARTRLTVGLVSTVFLGIDHSFTRGGPPILFETMVFGHAGIEDTYRYATWDEALEGHQITVANLTVIGARLSLAKGGDEEDIPEECSCSL
jgi:hypothetical protein